MFEDIITDKNNTNFPCATCVYRNIPITSEPCNSCFSEICKSKGKIKPNYKKTE